MDAPFLSFNYGDRVGTHHKVSATLTWPFDKLLAKHFCLTMVLFDVNGLYYSLLDDLFLFFLLLILLLVSMNLIHLLFRPVSFYFSFSFCSLVRSQWEFSRQFRVRR